MRSIRFSKSTRLKRGCCLSLCSSAANMSSWCFRMEPGANRSIRFLRFESHQYDSTIARYDTSSRRAVVVVFKHLDRFSHKEDLLSDSYRDVWRQHLCSQRELLQRRSQHVLLLNQPLHNRRTPSTLCYTWGLSSVLCGCVLTRSCSSLSCFPLKPPSPRSSSSSSWLAAAPPALGPLFTKNSSLWSSRNPWSIQAASCLYITPWHTARILLTFQTRDTETERHRDRETQRQETQRQRDTETERHRDRDTERHRDTERCWYQREMRGL